MSDYKIYPPIGIARVGNATSKFYIGPETYRGLPIDPDTNQPITEDGFRDEQGRMCRQAARFRIYKDGEEITLATANVKDIRWTVHMANKKASWYEFATNEGEHGYASNHPLRNAKVSDRHSLIIDPGPRQISGASSSPVMLDKYTVPAGYQGANFPPPLLFPTTDSIDTLGELHTDGSGRLLVLGGLGISGSGKANHGIQQYANNDDWWDDTGDGPVYATIEWQDGSTTEVSPAWVSVAPPSYAPEIPNLVTLWDTIFDGAVREGRYPEICESGFWKQGASGYLPNFQTEIKPLLERAATYTWVAAIPPRAHSYDIDSLGILPTPQQDQYKGFRQWILDILRPPSNENTLISGAGRTMMPYLAGDNCLIDGTLTSDYLRLTDTQYFFMQQWAEGYFTNETPAADGPDQLTRNILDNCVGGAFSPGIELTWISRNRTIYQPADPLRINAAAPTMGPLSLGFTPQAMEPGDLTRYMAIPWQADFNECSSQPIGDRVLWWWPAQRPEFVYLQQAPDYNSRYAKLAASGSDIPTPDRDTPNQQPWIGTGFDQTRGDFIAFADDTQMVEYWSQLGFVMGKDIDGELRFVEVARTLPRPFVPADE
ncbi:LodA/GoxA family CTQ-dependent oxidase [Oceanobacter mangrovi]|uniref:LodA/GoxA family CTQ-dependent oxidase n=1 Tax=Oceanobacter mangrovi TaxID=2862510 RepID=UPI001C8EC1C4|nr:LodA/GoxA family CTQ-dependent oxidase [Oceanobacter mangrovi]